MTCNLSKDVKCFWQTLTIIFNSSVDSNISWLIRKASEGGTSRREAKIKTTSVHQQDQRPYRHTHALRTKIFNKTTVSHSLLKNETNKLQKDSATKEARCSCLPARRDHSFILPEQKSIQKRIVTTKNHFCTARISFFVVSNPKKLLQLYSKNKNWTQR